MWARTDNDAVAEIILSPRPIEIGGVAYPRDVFTLWTADDLSAIGIIPATYADTAPSPYHVAADTTWHVVGGEAVGTRTWELPAASVAALKAYAADVRWRKETGGTTVGGIAIPTDDRTKVLLMGAALGMADEDTASYVVGATSTMLTGAQFKELYAGLIAHVQMCFDAQATVIAGIDDGSIATRAQIDEAFS